MRYPTLMLFAIACLMVVSSPTTALWETRFGSEERDYHCVPISQPQWATPTLRHFDAWQDDYFSNEHLGLWVLDDRDVPWLDYHANVIVARSWDSYLKIYSQDFEVLWETQMEFNLANALDLVNILGLEAPQILVAPALGPRTAIYDLKGELLAEWKPAPIVPGVIGLGGSHMGMPATADFTGDGRIEAFLHGVYQWYGYNHEGETIVQQPVVHPYDKGWSTSRGHEENGITFVYAVTMSYPGLTVDDQFPLASRLHKQFLQPIPGGAAPPYRLHEVWMKEFPGLIHVDDIRFHDLTGNGQDEIILSHRPRGHPDTKALTIMDLDGTILYQHPWNTGSKTAIGDANGDGTQEVILMLIDDDESAERQLKPWTYMAGVQWNGRHFEEIYRFQIDDEYGTQTIAVCDVDGDGADEVLVTFHESMNQTRPHGLGRAKLVQGDGTILWSYEFPYGAPIYPRIVDLDGNGAYDFLITTSATQLFVFSPTLEPEPAGGPGAPADPYITYLLERPHLTRLVPATDAPATTVADVPASAVLGPVLLALACLILTARRRR